MKGKKTGGRNAGTPNKVTKELQIMAQPYGEDAIETLAKVMRESPNDTARIAAAKELLDRGYGKAKQSIEHSSEDGTMKPRSLGDFYASLPTDPLHAAPVYLEVMVGSTSAVQDDGVTS